MITNVLVEHRWLAPTALALLLVLGPLVAAWLLPRPRIAGALTALSLLPVLLLTLVPVDRRLYHRCEVAWTLPTPGRVELAANVVLFIVPALLATVAVRRPLLVTGAASAFSAAIEVFQALVPALGRSCSTNDWLSNTIGGLIGVLLAWAAMLLVGARLRRGPAGIRRSPRVPTPSG